MSSALQEPNVYDSSESLYREARNLRPLYENLYDYEAYGEDLQCDEFFRRLKAFYRRHRLFFITLEGILELALCSLFLAIIP